MRSILGRLSAAIAIAAAIAGCSNELPGPIATGHPGANEPRRGGVLAIATFADIRAIDPANIADGFSPQLLEAIFAGLVDYDYDTKVVPDLAERWEIADDGKTFRFFLREGVPFQDGEELTAEDVKRSTERALHPTAPTPSPYFSSILGYDDFAARKAEHLEGVVVEGRYVVSYKLKERDAMFLRALAMPMLRPVCKSGGDRYVDTWRACGAGPFKLMPGGWDHGRSLTLVRHDGYFRHGQPYLDAVTWTLHQSQLPQRFKFERGELDVLRDFLTPDLLRYQSDPRWKPFGDYSGRHEMGGESMNVQMPPFDNVEIRRAVAAAIDREELRLVRASNMSALDQAIPPEVFGYDPSLRGQHYDYPAALEHMKRAGYPYDPVTKKGGWPGVVPYVVYKQSLPEFLGQVLAQQLAKIGIVLELHVVNYPTFMALRGREKTSPMGPGMWTMDFPDAMSFLEPMFHSKSITPEDSTNPSFYSNPRVDELLDEAHRELDDARRLKLYSETQQILIDDAPWAFTYSFNRYCQWQPYVRDYRTHPVWTHEASRTWLDRAAGPIGARAIFRRDALASLLGEEKKR